MELIFDDGPGLSYAWRFPVTATLANVGYGRQIPDHGHLSRTDLEASLRRLLPGVSVVPGSLRAHRLPLSSSRQKVARGRVLLAGDAAALINPISGEGIYYAIVSGLAAGSAAAADPATAAAAYQAQLHRRLGNHFNHVSVLASVTRSRSVLEAGLLAVGDDPAAFDDLAAVGLGEGRITARLAGGLARRLVTDLLIA
jgi:flavin-dependent dehydrogenase